MTDEELKEASIVKGVLLGTLERASQFESVVVVTVDKSRQLRIVYSMMDFPNVLECARVFYEQTIRAETAYKAASQWP